MSLHVRDTHIPYKHFNSIIEAIAMMIVKLYI
jgi:hypothetical protein